MGSLPEDVQNLLKKWIKEGKLSQDELMNVLPKAEEDIELLDHIYNLLMQFDIELVDEYSWTWDLLEAYDRWSIEILGNRTTVNVNIEVFIALLENSIIEFRKSRIRKWETSELFGHEVVNWSLVGVIKDIFQTWDGKDLYPTLEEKAAHLLYFIIKNHPFVDWNKRCWAFSFIVFLQFTDLFDLSKITSETLSVIALLVAESNPKNKDLIIQVIINTVLVLLIKK